MGKCTVRGDLDIKILLETIAMIFEKRENVKITLKIEDPAEQSVNSKA